MMFDGSCTMRNEYRDQEKVSQLGSIFIFPANNGNGFAMVVSTRDL